jgi:alkanesulfonate monooxygenase
MQLLLAVRMGEMWPPQLARQLATVDQILDGRLTVNVISSDLPGQALESTPRYKEAEPADRGLEALRPRRLSRSGPRAGVPAREPPRRL